MRWPFSRRVTTTVVRIAAGPDEPLTRIAPTRASEHDRVLSELTTLPTSWATEVLGTLLRDIGAGHTLELIAAVDAWIEDPDTFCLLYTPPFTTADLIVGIRRRRGDLDPHLPMYRRSRYDPGDLVMPDDPHEYAEDTNISISEPLGNASKILRFDDAGIGWWGTLDELLPIRPS